MTQSRQDRLRSLQSVRVLGSSNGSPNNWPGKTTAAGNDSGQVETALGPWRSGSFSWTIIVGGSGVRIMLALFLWIWGFGMPPHFLDCLETARLKGLPRMPVSLGPVSVTRSLKLVVARWSKELNTCRMPQGEGRGVMWGLWTFLRAAWHHVVVIVPCRQPQLTNCQNQGGRTTIQTKWWWDLSLQHFGGIDFNSTGWNLKTSAKFGCFTQRDLVEWSWRLSQKSSS